MKKWREYLKATSENDSEIIDENLCQEKGEGE